MTNRINGHETATPLEVARTKLGPPKECHPYVLRLKGGQGYNFHVYSPTFWGFKIHWAGDHSEPHFTDGTHCPGCARELPSKERYYLFCWCIDKKQHVFLEFTESAARKFEEQLPPKSNMRGLGIFVSRTKADNGRLKLHLAAGRLDEKTLPPDRDPLPALMALWRVRPGRPFTGLEFPTATRREVVTDDDAE